MKILICGMGEVGTHSTEFLNKSGRSITAVDTDPAKLRTIADTMDVSVLQGNCASAAILREAGQAGMIESLGVGFERRVGHPLGVFLDHDAAYAGASDSGETGPAQNST